MFDIATIQKTGLNVVQTCIDGCVEIQKGVLWVGEGVARTMTYMYSVKGLASLSKVLISFLELISLIDATARLTFREGVKNLKAFKDTLYATFWISSLTDLIVNPRSRKDVVKVLNCIGDFFEFFKFLEKNGVFSFSLINKGANFCNSWRISVLPFSWGDCPAPLNPFCERPKDFFIFWSSCIDIIRGVGETYEWIRNPDPNKQVDPVNIAKRTGSLGKMILISFGNAGLGLSIIDNITQLSALVKLILEKEKQRDARLARPPVIAAS